MHEEEKKSKALWKKMRDAEIWKRHAADNAIHEKVASSLWGKTVDKS